MGSRYRATLLAMLLVSCPSVNWAGNVRGPVCFESKAVESGDVAFYEATMRPEEPARVTVSGDPQLRVDLRVLDRYGKVACDADETSGQARSCQWSAANRGPYRILVTEIGTDTPYRVCTN